MPRAPTAPAPLQSPARLEALTLAPVRGSALPLFLVRLGHLQVREKDSLDPEPLDHLPVLKILRKQAVGAALERGF